MRISEIVDLMQRNFPLYTDLFHDVVSISSITASATLATVATASPHGLVTGQIVALTDIKQNIAISSVALNGLEHTFTTDADHDLTFGDPRNPNVLLSGFTDSFWNASHAIAGVPNRRNFKISNLEPSPLLNGNELLLQQAIIGGVNGVFPVTVVSSTVFTVAGTFPVGTYTVAGGRVVSNPRIWSAPTFERAEELYHSDPLKYAAVVVPADTTVSKDRSTESDAVSARLKGDTLRLRLLDEFSVLVFAPTTDEIAAVEAMDILRHDLLQPITRSLYGARLQTGLACETSEFSVAFTGHGILAFRDAYMIHQYDFQAPADLSSEDAVKQKGDRAFREIDYTMLGVPVPLTFGANLDEEPLP